MRDRQEIYVSTDVEADGPIPGVNFMLRHWFSSSSHTHRALDDAIEQGILFCNMLNELKGGGSEDSQRMQQIQS